jgi:putative peptide zinc metalloprotease protein
MPVPYVDASAATAFRSRAQRMAVSAAGIMVELLLAALAMLVWLQAQDGWVRDAAFVIMTIGGVSSLLFNGNPLMRLDGYYMLSDFLEIPNLATRANQRFVYLLQRYLLRMKTADSGDLDTFEARLLPCYAIASFVYRVAISAAVILWISDKSLSLAWLAGLWMGWGMLLRPLLRSARFLLSSPTLAHSRARAIGICFGVVGVVSAALFALPLPSLTRAQGVVWQPDDTALRAAAAGEVEQLVATDGQMLKAGDLIAVLINPELQASAKVLEARAAGLLVKINQALNEDNAALQGLQEQLTTVTAQLARAHADLEALRICATVAGRLVIPRAEDLPGRFLKKGATLGYILTGETLLIRVAVTQDQAGRIRAGGGPISLRLAEDLDQILSGIVVREVPAASGLLHSAALGDRNDGPIRTDPEDKDGLRTLEPVFVFDVAVTGEQARRLGGRAFLRFDHGSETAGDQLGRALRQLFLRHS